MRERINAWTIDQTRGVIREVCFDKPTESDPLDKSPQFYVEYKCRNPKPSPEIGKVDEGVDLDNIGDPPTSRFAYMNFPFVDEKGILGIDRTVVYDCRKDWEYSDSRDDDGNILDCLYPN